MFYTYEKNSVGCLSNVLQIVEEHATMRSSKVCPPYPGIICTVYVCTKSSTDTTIFFAETLGNLSGNLRETSILRW